MATGTKPSTGTLRTSGTPRTTGRRQPGDTPLPLVVAPAPRRHLSRRTRQVGLAGVAAARQELEAARARVRAREEARAAQRRAQVERLASVA